MRTHSLVTFISGHRGRLACLALWLLATVPGGAQVATRFRCYPASGSTEFALDFPTGAAGVATSPFPPVRRCSSPSSRMRRYFLMRLFPFRKEKT
jgi:hypothetical protein